MAPLPDGAPGAAAASAALPVADAAGSSLMAAASAATIPAIPPPAAAAAPPRRHVPAFFPRYGVTPRDHGNLELILDGRINGDTPQHTEAAVRGIIEMLIKRNEAFFALPPRQAPAAQPGTPVAPQAPALPPPPFPPPPPSGPPQLPVQQPAACAAFVICISVTNVDQHQIHRLTSKIEQVLRGCAVKLLIARDGSDATILNLSCAISSTTPHDLVEQDLRLRHIPECFPGGHAGGHAVLVTSNPMQGFDDSAQASDFFRLFCSELGWMVIYDGPGEATGRAAAGSLIQVPGLCFAPEAHSRSI